MSVNYLNLYVFAIFGGLAATVGGILVCYSGMSETSYLVYRGMEITTYYLDKNRHDLYVNGMVYSITFGIAFLLLLAVIVIPSPEQIQKRLAVSPFTGENSTLGITAPSVETLVEEETPAADDESLEIELEPDVESFEVNDDEEFESTQSSVLEDEDLSLIHI